MPWLTIMQVALLIAWFTVLPTLPAWVVFLPLILGAAGLCVSIVLVGLAAAVAAFANR